MQLIGIWIIFSEGRAIVILINVETINRKLVLSHLMLMRGSLPVASISHVWYMCGRSRSGKMHRLDSHAGALSFWFCG